MKKLLIVGAVCAICLMGFSQAAMADEETVTITDVEGREVTVTLPVENAYLGFYYENFLTVVGPDAFTKVGSTSLYDTEGFFNTLCEMYSEYVDGYNDMVDIGSTMRDDFDLEKLIELECDCCILGSYQYNSLGDDKIDILENAGIPVVVINYSLFSDEAKRESTEILGKIFQVEDRAQEILDEYFGRLEKVREITAKIPEEEKKTTFHEWCSTFSSFSEIGSSDSRETYLGFYLNAAGAEDIAFPVFEKDPEHTGVLEKEYILEQDPEYWFCIGGEAKDSSKDMIIMGYGVTEEEVLASCEELIPKRPGFETLRAVKDGHVYFLDNSMIRTMRDSILAEWIGKTLYPEYYEDMDPEAEWAAFSEKYLPMLPTEGIYFYNYNPEV